MIDPGNPLPPPGSKPGRYRYIEEARSHLHALLGIVTLEPRDGVLWEHPSQNAKGLVETRPLDDLHINRQKLVAGARLLEN